MKVILATLSISILTSCALPTPYQNQKDGYGKKILEMNGTGRISVFSGNHKTSKVRAERFSKLAALEYCHEQGKKTLLDGQLDLSETSTFNVVNASSYSIGNQYKTMISSYPVMRTYPYVLTRFHCLNRFSGFMGDVKLKKLAKEMVHAFTKDFKGGLMVEQSANEASLKKGDVIIAIEGKRVENEAKLREILFALDSPPLKTRVQIIRNKKIQTISTKVVDQTKLLSTVADLEKREACELKEESEEAIPFCSGISENKQISKLGSVKERALKRKKNREPWY